MSPRFFPYLPFLFISIFLSATISFTLHYLTTGQTSMDSRSPLLWGRAAGFFILFVLGYKFVPWRRRCCLCQEKARDVLIYPDRKSKRLCRAHLLQEFREVFLKFEGEMVVFYPALELKDGPYFYQFWAINDVPKKLMENKVGSLVKRALLSVSESGSCSRCGRMSTVAYFGPGTFRWEAMKTGGVEWEIPRFEEIRSEPALLCNRCVVDELIHSLRYFNGSFSEAVVLPYAERGVFLPGIN